MVGITQPWFVGETAAQKIHGIYRMFLLKSFEIFDHSTDELAEFVS